MKKNRFLLYILFLSITFFSINSIVYAAGDTISFSCSEDGISNMLQLVKRAYNIIRIAAPLLLVIMGSIDFLRATMASKQEDMDKYKKRFFTRIKLAIILFLLFAFFQLVTNLLTSAGVANSDSWLSCWNSLWIR